MATKQTNGKQPAKKRGRPAGGRKLGPELLTELAQKQAGGMSLAQLAELAKQRGVDVSRHSVRSAIIRHQAAGALALAAKTEARTEIAPAVGGAARDLLVALEEATRVRQLAAAAAKIDLTAVSTFERAVRAWAKIQELVQQASGMNDSADENEKFVDGLSGLLQLSLDEEAEQAEAEREAAANAITVQ